MGALDRDLRNMGTTVVLAVWRVVRWMHLTVRGLCDGKQGDKIVLKDCSLP